MVKRKFSIHMKSGRKVGETWAVSASKACTNYWWKFCKGGDKFAYTDYKPSDFVARLAD
jgi:hypothetical protein